MNLFKRRKKVNPNLPPEVQAYSQAEHRERMGMAWLVGIVSLVVSLLVVTCLFLGGRWLYRKIANNSSQPTKVITESEEDNKDNKDSDNKDSNGQVTDDSASTDDDNQSSSSSSGSSSSTTPSSGSTNGTSTTTPTQQPASGGTEPAGTLPNTGPDIDL